MTFDTCPIQPVQWLDMLSHNCRDRVTVELFEYPPVQPKNNRNPLEYRGEGWT